MPPAPHYLRTIRSHVLVYVVTGRAIGEAVMIQAAFLPLWLPLIGTPHLLALLFIALDQLDFIEFV